MKISPQAQEFCCNAALTGAVFAGFLFLGHCAIVGMEREILLRREASTPSHAAPAPAPAPPSRSEPCIPSPATQATQGC